MSFAKGNDLSADFFTAAIRLSLAIVVPESSVVLIAFLMLDIEHLFLMLVLYLCLYATKEMLCIDDSDAGVMAERYGRRQQYSSHLSN
jgi:hypothetical protein